MSCISGKEEQLCELVGIGRVVEEKEYLKGHFETFEGRLGDRLKEVIYVYSVSYSEYSADSIGCSVAGKKYHFDLGKNKPYDGALVAV
jgi:hypothetical protein